MIRLVITSCHSSDIDKTVHFYCSVLGMKLDRFTPADGSPNGWLYV